MTINNNDSTSHVCDVIIIGGGPGGYDAAIKCTQNGFRTMLVDERITLGGICLNEGCIPTKSLLQSVKMYRSLKEVQKWGLHINGTVNAELKEIVARKNIIVEQLTQAYARTAATKGIAVLHGKARLLEPHKVEVNDQIYEARHIIIATGSMPKKLPIPGIESPHVLTSTEALNLQELPEHLVIIGAGAIGIEFAAIMNTLGSKVAVVEILPEILPGADRELAAFLRQYLQHMGVEFYLNTVIEKIELEKVSINVKGEHKNLRCSKVLLAVGREPNLACLDGDLMKQLVGSNGFIETDPKMKTKVDSIWAIGDVNGKHMLAHVASAEGIVAASVIAGQDATMDYRFIPQCVYTELELAGVGLTEESAHTQNLAYDIARFPLVRNGKAMCDGTLNGAIKVIAGQRYKDILGVHILAPHASELIAEAIMALHMEVTAEELVKMIHPHPTLSEIYPEVAHKLLGLGLHG